MLESFLSGRTPPHAVDMVRAVVAAGANPDCADAAGTTPRASAAQHFDADSRELVLAALTVRTMN
jgi:hypothetical protein